MKNKLYLLWLCCIVMVSCKQKENPIVNSNNDDSRIIEIKEKDTTKTVDLEKYNLISDSDKDRKSDAVQILALKRKWPLIMQAPNRVEFDKILSKNFVFIDNGHLLNRENYIKDRTAPSDWKITFVKYENLTLQFFGNTAVLSYRNHVTNENVRNGAIEIEHINWVDIYVLENEHWKIASAHVIAISTEKK